MEASYNVVSNYHANNSFIKTINPSSSAMYIMPPKPLIVNGKEIKCLNVSNGGLENLVNVDILKDFLLTAKNHMVENIKDYEITNIKLKDADLNEINVYLKNFNSLNDGELKSALITRNKDGKSAELKLFNAHYFIKTNPGYKCLSGGEIDRFQYSELQDKLSNILINAPESNSNNRPVSRDAGHSTSAIYIFNSNGAICLSNVSGEKIKKDINPDEDLLAPFLVATQICISKGMFKNCDLDSIELKKDSERISMHFRSLKVNDKEIRAVAIFKGKVDNFEISKKMMDIQYEFKKWSKYINNSGSELPANIKTEVNEYLDKLL